MQRGKYKREPERFKGSGYLEDKFTTKMLKLICLNGETDMDALGIFGTNKKYVYRKLGKLKKDGLLKTVQLKGDKSRNGNARRIYLQNPERDFESLKMYLGEEYREKAIESRSNIVDAEHKRILDQSEIIAFMIQNGKAIGLDENPNDEDVYITKSALVEHFKMTNDLGIRRGKLNGIYTKDNAVTKVYYMRDDAIVLDMESERNTDFMLKKYKREYEVESTKENIMVLKKGVADLSGLLPTFDKRDFERRRLTCSGIADKFLVYELTYDGALIFMLNEGDGFSEFSDEEILGEKAKNHFIEYDDRVEVNFLEPDIRNLFQIRLDKEMKSEKKYIVYTYKSYEDGVKSILGEDITVKTLETKDVLDAYVEYLMERE